MNRQQLACRFLILISFTLTACDNGGNYAPVVEASLNSPIPKNGVHRVVHGESLYEIAWSYGMDYRELAALNHLSAPYTLHSGQTLNLRPTSAVSIRPVSTSVAPIAVDKPEPQFTQFNPKQWAWPLQGKVIHTYSAMNKGIDIAGVRGAPILAAAPGKVVYAGHGLRGYGNLVIIKHDSQYLSAYAHNDTLLVHEGQWVKRGESIATLGSTDAHEVAVHFEIRKAGKSINPMDLLS